MSRAPSEALRDQWLGALLPDVAFEGWTEEAAAQAAASIGLGQGEQALAAPGGVGDLIEHFFDRAERRARERLEASDLSQQKVHQRVATGVRAWLDALDEREAVRRAIAWGMRPWRAGQPLQRTWSVADMIWTCAGDLSQDYNKYSKRGLLASTLPAIVFYWLDETDGDKLDAYIARRLKAASDLGRTGGRLFKPFLRSAN